MQWVVTYKHQQIDGGILVTEFYRGSRDECVRICTHSGEGEDDRCRTQQWRPVIGTASSWDEFVSQAAEDGTVVVIGGHRR